MKRLFTLLIVIGICCVSLSGCKKIQPLSLQVISDIHYAGDEFFSYTGSYAIENDRSGSGKQMKYQSTILDAYIQQVNQSKPQYVIITGDLTYFGAKLSHEALVQKLQEMDSSIQVLVLPGNHDIYYYSYICPDGEPIASDPITAQQFQEIYSDYGYNQAISKDENSLSYVVDTHQGTRIFMLDTNFSYGATYGKINDKTMAWLEEELKKCVKAKDTPIVFGHHNLITQNPLFEFDYTLGNSKDVSALLQKYGVTLYMSGHLHVQHIMQQDNIADIVSGSFAVWPHRYGQLTVDGSIWQYQSYETDVQSYAKATNCSDENLLNYNEYGYQFYYKNSYRQSYERIVELDDQPEIREKLADFCANANVCYFAGRLDLLDRQYYSLYQQYTYNNLWSSYINSFIDEQANQLSLSYRKNEGFQR